MNAARRNRLRWLASLVLPLYLSGYGGEVLHGLLFPHALCPVHLEIIEAPTTPVEPEHSTHAAFNVTDDDSDHTHDHCSLVTTRIKDTAVTRLASGATRSLSDRALLPAQGHVLAFEHQPRYRLAPKTSPPV